MKGKVFNAQEVQAILNKSKVMFREVIKVQPPKDLPSDCVVFQPYKDHQHIWTIQSCGIGVKEYERRTPFSKADGIEYWRELAPYQVGQKIFVKERFCEKADQDTFEILEGYHYAATCGFDVFKMDSDGWTKLNKDGSEALAWKPAQHMKQEHSRLTLQISEIRVKRLAEISESDCCEEGFGASFLRDYKRPRFIENWNATHKKPEEKFEANPWVWVYQFELIT